MPEVKTKVTGGYSYDTNNKEYNYQVNYYSEVIDGEKFDTEVCIDPDDQPGIHLCVISGKDIEEFDKEFSALITKYRI